MEIHHIKKQEEQICVNILTLVMLASVTVVSLDTGIRVKTRHTPLSGVSFPSAMKSFGLVVLVTFVAGKPTRVESGTAV